MHFLWSEDWFSTQPIPSITISTLSSGAPWMINFSTKYWPTAPGIVIANWRGKGSDYTKLVSHAVYKCVYSSLTGRACIWLNATVTAYVWQTVRVRRQLSFSALTVFETSKWRRKLWKFKDLISCTSYNKILKHNTKHKVSDFLLKLDNIC